MRVLVYHDTVRVFGSHLLDCGRDFITFASDGVVWKLGLRVVGT